MNEMFQIKSVLGKNKKIKGGKSENVNGDLYRSSMNESFRN